METEYGFYRMIASSYAETKALYLLLNVLFREKKMGAGGSVWYERRLRKAEVAGSNPARSTPNFFSKEV